MVILSDYSSRSDSRYVIADVAITAFQGSCRIEDLDKITVRHIN